MIYLGWAGTLFQSVWPSVAVKHTNKGAINRYFTTSNVMFIRYRDTLDNGRIQHISGMSLG